MRGGIASIVLWPRGTARKRLGNRTLGARCKSQLFSNTRYASTEKYQQNLKVYACHAARLIDLCKKDLQVHKHGSQTCMLQELLTVKHHIDRSIDSPLCRMYGKCGESVQHIVSGCEKLAQKEYKRRQHNVAKKIHSDLCKKHDLEHHEKWCDHILEGVIENDKVKLLWDISILSDYMIEARRPDIVVIDKKERVCIILDITVPADRWVEEKEEEKVEKYQDLKRYWKNVGNAKKCK